MLLITIFTFYKFNAADHSLYKLQIKSDHSNLTAMLLITYNA